MQGRNELTIWKVAENSKGEKALLQQIINCLLMSLGDPIIKIQALRGLGNIVSVEIEEVCTYLLWFIYPFRLTNMHQVY